MAFQYGPAAWGELSFHAATPFATAFSSGVALTPVVWHAASAMRAAAAAARAGIFLVIGNLRHEPEPDVDVSLRGVDVPAVGNAQVGRSVHPRAALHDHAPRPRPAPAPAPYAVDVHCQTLPAMSSRPYAFAPASKLPTGEGAVNRPFPL